MLGVVAVAILVGDVGGVRGRCDGVDARGVPVREDIFFVGCREFGTGHVPDSVRSDHVVWLSGYVADSTVRRRKGTESSHGS